MKILVVFVDMIRPNVLSTYQTADKSAGFPDTPLDSVLKELNCTIYRQCFTPGPDTIRSLASLYSGKPPWENGCNNRGKMPQFFLNESPNHLFDHLKEAGYGISCFHDPVERSYGIFPQSFMDDSCHNVNYDLKDYLKTIKLQDNHFVWVGLADFHHGLDDYGATKTGVKKAFLEIEESLSIVFDCLDKESFDHLFIFSDHGFKYSSERKVQPPYFNLNEDRSQLLMAHRKKNQTRLGFNDQLFSIEDFHKTLLDLIGVKSPLNTNGLSMFSQEEREFVIVEDQPHFYDQVPIGLWALINKQFIYFRTPMQGYSFDRQTRQFTVGIRDKEDCYLMDHNATFKDSWEISFKKFKGTRDIQNLPLLNQTFSSGKKRVGSMEKIVLSPIVFQRLNACNTKQNFMFSSQLFEFVVEQNEFPENVVGIIEAFSQWMIEILDLNRQFQVYNQKTLEYYFGKWFYKNCFKLTRYGWIVYQAYWRSKISDLFHLSVKSRLEFWIRCQLKIVN